MVAGSSGAGGVPFATFDGALESERYPADFHLLEKGKCTYEKVRKATTLGRPMFCWVWRMHACMHSSKCSPGATEA